MASAVPAGMPPVPGLGLPVILYMLRITLTLPLLLTLLLLHLPAGHRHESHADDDGSNGPSLHTEHGGSQSNTTAES